MKVAFFTNYMTHHQIGFCEEMNSLLCGNFYVVVFKPLGDERKMLGFADTNSIYSYIIRAYESDEEKQKALSLCANADVVIWGSAPVEYLKERRKLNKLTFIYTERIFKKGLIHLLDPRVIAFLKNKFYSQKNKKQYYMCASGYTAHDINLVTHTPQKFFKWGYFPKVCEKKLDSVLEKKNTEKIKILWAGRLIDWKHPEAVVCVATYLKKKNSNFVINIVGAGDQKENIQQMINKSNLQNEVHLCGSKTPDEIVSYYEAADIFLATSDKQEGWGAVVNEAMSYGCAVVASHEMGSVPFLIENNENGIVFRSGDWRKLSESVFELVENADKRNKIATNAYYTIKDTWNAKSATKRLVELFESLLDGSAVDFDDGPCSISTVMTEREFLKSTRNIEN